MSDEVASLGFEVDSQPLEKSAAALKDLSTAAKTVPEPIAAIEAAAKRASVSVDEMRQRMATASSGAATFGTGLHNAGTALGSVSTAVSQSQGIWSSLAAALGATTGSFSANASAAKALGAEHRAASEVGKEFRETIHTLGPALEQAGFQMSALTQFSGAARGGLVALGAAIAGGVVLEMAKAAGETEGLKTRLDGLAGIKMGNQLFNDLKNVSTELGIFPKSVEPALESLIKFQQQVASSGGPITLFGPDFASNLNEAQLGGRNLAGIVKTLFEELRIGGANTKDATAEVNSFFAEVTKKGQLTADTFKKLQDVAPAAAEALARALNNSSAGDFVKKLDLVPDTLSRVADALRKLEPAADAGFKRLIDDPKNIGDAFDKLKTKAEDLWKTIAGESTGDSVTRAISKTADEFDQLGKGLPDFRQKLNDQVSKPWSDMVKTMDDQNSIFGKSLDIDFDGAIIKALATLGRLPGEGLQSLADFANGAISKLESVGSAAISMAQKVAQAVAGMASGGSAAAAGGVGGTEGIGMGAFSDPNAPGGQSSGILFPSGDAGTIDFGDLGGGDIPAFAGGGQLIVGGSGGTDSQLVTIKATPGEVLTVSTPDQMAQTSNPSGGIQGLTTLQGPSAVGVVSATPDPASLATIKEITDAIDQSTIDITKNVLTGSDNIVNTLNKLIGGVAATTVNPSTGLPVTSTTSSTALGGFGSLTPMGFGSASTASAGGGGFNTQSGHGMGDELAKSIAQDLKDNPPLTPQQYYGNPAYGYPGGAFGQAVPIKGAGPLPGTTLPRREPISRLPGTSGPSGIARQSFSGGFGQSISSPVSDFSGESSGFNGTLSDIGGGMSDFFGTDVGGSGMLSGSLSDIGGGTSDFFGTDSSGSGMFSGSISDIGTTIIPEGSGGIEGFAGDFAKGGSILVGGDGGIDTTPISIMATKGEHVIVLPKGVASPALDGLSSMPAANIPSGIAMPQVGSGNSAASDASQVSTTTTTNKNIIINVHPGIQAEQFIKSRAQIARGL